MCMIVHAQQILITPYSSKNTIPVYNEMYLTQVMSSLTCQVLYTELSIWDLF